MKLSRELSTTLKAKALVQGVLSLVLALSMAFSATSFAYADEVNSAILEGIDKPSGAIDQENDNSSGKTKESSETSLPVDESEQNLWTEEGKETTDAKETNQQEDAVIPNEASNEVVQDDSEALAISAGVPTEPTAEVKVALAAQDQKGSFANTQGVENAISWNLAANGTLTINGTGGISDFKFHPTNPTSAFAGGGSTAEDGTQITQAALYESIKNIVIGEGITSLGASVFSARNNSGASNIQSVSLPNTLVSLGQSFQYCKSLASIRLPNALTSIEDNTFQNCSVLALTSLPDSITSIGTNAFSGCSVLALTSLPDSITNIGAYAFQNCKTLELTSLPNSLTSMGSHAFSGCTALALTSLPDGLTSIENNTFAGCTALALTSLSSSITNIGAYAFQNCKTLELTSLPNSLTSMTTYAFSGCTALALTSLPDGLTSIGNSAFSNCTALALTSLPDGLTSIGNSAFANCTALALTSLPDGLTSIGNNTFDTCTVLALTSLPSSITSIGSYAFANCKELEIGWFEDSLTNIGSFAFIGCTKIAALDVVSVVRGTAIGSSAFPAGPKLVYRSTEDSVLFEGTFDNAEGAADAIFWTLDDEGILTITGTGGVGDFKFHKSNPASAFTDGLTAANETPVSQDEAYEKIKSIFINAGITSLGSSVFSLDNDGSVNIETLVLPSTLSTMGSSAFESVDSLKTITFDAASTLSIIEAAAFKGCTALALTSLPTTVTTIGDEAFSGCVALRLASLPAALAVIGDGAFLDCNTIAFTTFPASLRSIGEKAFQGCTAFAKVDFVEGLTSIGSLAFSGCSNLQIEWFPNSLQSIGANAFDGCTKMLELAMVSLFIDSKSGVDEEAFPEGTALLYRNPHPIEESGTFANSEGVANAISWTLKDGVLTIIGTGGIGNFKFHSSNANSVFKSYVREDDGTRVTQAMMYESIKSIAIGEGITSLEGAVFAPASASGISNIQSVSLPSGLSSIGPQAFRYCASLETINFPTSLATIGTSAFQGCSSLTAITFEEGLEAIGNSAFVDCGNLQISWLPNSLVSIGQTVFIGCTTMSGLSVSVYGATSIDPTAFPEDTNIELREAPGYYIATGVFWNFSEDSDGGLTLTVSGRGGAWINAITTANFFKQHPEYVAANVKHLVVEEGITTITDHFKASPSSSIVSLTGLETVHLAASVESIKSFNSSPLSSLTIAENSKLTTIEEDQAFAACLNLTSLDFSDTQLTSVPRQTFGRSTNLKEILLPVTFTSITQQTFWNLPTLENVSLPGITRLEKITFANSHKVTPYVSRKIEAIDAQLGNSSAPADNAMTVFVIGSSTAPIEGLAFANISYEAYKDTTNSDDAYVLNAVGQTIEFTCDYLNIPVSYKVTGLGALDENSDAMHAFKAMAYDEETVLQGTASLKMEDESGAVVEALGRDASLTISIADESLEGKELQIYALSDTPQEAVYVQAATVINGLVQVTKAQPNTSYAAFAMQEAPTTYSVSFQSNGGSAVSSQTIEKGKLATVPTAPVRSGYTFTGWYTSAALTETFDFSTPIESVITLYASWEQISVEETPSSENNGNDRYPPAIIGGGTRIVTQTSAAATNASDTEESTSDNANTSSSNSSSSSAEEESEDSNQSNASGSTIDEDESPLSASTQESQGFQWWWLVAGLAVAATFALGVLLRSRKGKQGKRP